MKVLLDWIARSAKNVKRAKLEIKVENVDAFAEKIRNYKFIGYNIAEIHVCHLDGLGDGGGSMRAANAVQEWGGAIVQTFDTSVTVVLEAESMPENGTQELTKLLCAVCYELEKEYRHDIIAKVRRGKLKEWWHKHKKRA